MPETKQGPSDRYSHLSAAVAAARGISSNPGEGDPLDPRRPGRSQGNSSWRLAWLLRLWRWGR